MSKQYRIAPPGFTSEHWQTFMDDGIVFIENALSDDDVEMYKMAMDRVAQAHSTYEKGETFWMENFVEGDPVLSDLIDHQRHVGFVYDIYGEQLKLQLTELFMRVPGGWHNKWHFDGARVVPKTVFSPVLPLQTKVSYWLTDLPHPKMGNFVYIPGSHRKQYLDAYHTSDNVSDEQILCVKKGTMTIHSGALWHRVEPNLSKTPRYNLFLCYSPSWITSGDRLTSDADWLKTLNREQRIIMRSYMYGYDHERPPAEDYPLFLDRDSGLDHDYPSTYMDLVDMRRRKRKTFHEKLNGVR